MNSLLTEIQSRWQQLFAALAGGEDAPPSLRLRTEGMMEAAILGGEITQATMHEQMDRCYRASFGRGLTEDFGIQWQSFYPFPQIPAVGRRAPVYPSTAE
jgi:hypothetical protein